MIKAAVLLRALEEAGKVLIHGRTGERRPALREIGRVVGATLRA